MQVLRALLEEFQEGKKSEGGERNRYDRFHFHAPIIGQIVSDFIRGIHILINGKREI